MRILNLLSILFLLLCLSHISLSVGFLDKLPRRLICLIRNTGGIRSQISDNTDRAIALNINSFIKLLCKPHRLLCGKVKDLRRLLLQRAGGKRKRCLLHPLSCLDLFYYEICLGDMILDF